MDGSCFAEGIVAREGLIYKFEEVCNSDVR